MAHSRGITKLGDLKHPESFIQVNFVKGFKYIDLAGQILNEYVSVENPPGFQMGLDGLVIQKPNPKIDELKISAYMLWAKFTDPDSLERTAYLLDVESKRVLPLICVSELSRIGWRNFFVHDFVDENEQLTFFRSLTTVPMSSGLFVNVKIETSTDIEATLRIQPVVKQESRTPAVLFDLDLSKTGIVRVDKLLSVLTRFREYLSKSNEFVNLINEVLTHD